MDLFIPEEVAELCSAACRTARYDEYIGLLESAVEDYEERADDCISAGQWPGEDLVQQREEARRRVELYAAVAAAYRPAVDPVALAREIKAALASAEGGEPR